VTNEPTSTSNFSLKALIDQIKDQSYPPVDLWNPDFCGDIDMQIKRDGSWHYMGSPIARERMVKLFASVLRCDEDGKHYLVTPVEKIGITVDVAPFLAITLEALGEGDARSLVFETNIGDKVIAGPDNPLTISVSEETGEPVPLIRVRGRLDALLTRPVFYQLVDLAEERGGILYVKSSGAEFRLGSVEGEP